MSPEKKVGPVKKVVHVSRTPNMPPGLKEEIIKREDRDPWAEAAAARKNPHKNLEDRGGKQPGVEITDRQLMIKSRYDGVIAFEGDERRSGRKYRVLGARRGVK